MNTAVSRVFRVLPALIISCAVVVSALILGRAFVRSHYDDDTIRVEGSARRIVRSDYIIWDAQVNYNAPTLSAAYTGLQSGVDSVNKYLLKKQISPDEIFPQAIQTTVLYNKAPADNANTTDPSVYRTIKGYSLTQTVEVRSGKVPTVQAAALGVSELINGGVSVQSQDPEYRILGLAELKDSILADASANALSRAQKIADSSHAQLGTLRFSHMGEMLVTGPYEDESPDGAENTSSLDKKVTVEVTSAYNIR